MSVSVSCPFCNAIFEVPQYPMLVRMACPRCDESASPERLRRVENEAPNGAITSAELESTTGPPDGLRSLGLILLGMLLLIGVAIGVWLWDFFPKSVPTDPATSPSTSAPPATKPAALLTALRFLPADVEMIVALQPSPLIQANLREGKTSSEALLALGIPKGLLEFLREADLPIEQIDHLALGLAMNQFPPRILIVFQLRKDLRSERDLRQALNARANPDAPGQYRVEVNGIPFPLEMTLPNARSIVLVSSDKDIPKTAFPDISHFRPALRESLQQLSPAAWAWLATDSQDWVNRPGLVPLLKLVDKNSWIEPLKKLRSLAIGLSLEPEYELNLGLRMLDANTATERSETLKTTLQKMNAQVTTNGEWTRAKVKAQSLADLGTILKELLQ